MPITRKLSPLELVLLGNVWKHDGCTAYALVRDLRKSKSAYYKSGAGSVYPAFKRMAAAGFVFQEPDDARYTITQKGIDASEQWFAPPFDEATFMCSLDLIRSRIYFLGLLPEDQREACLNQILTGLRSLEGQVNLIVEGGRASGDPFELLASMGAFYETKARIEWVEYMQKELGSSLP